MRSNYMDVFNVLSDLMREKKIQEMSFCHYPKQQLIQEKYQLSDTEMEQVQKAIHTKKNTGLPFWDSLMLTFFNNEKCSGSLLSATQHHNKNQNLYFTSNITQVRDSIEKGNISNLSVCSKIVTEDTEKHLLFIDFHIPPSSLNLCVVTSVCAILNLHGYILNSGESYHFIGKEVYDSDAIINFLAKLLLFSPIVDRAWIAHQILERACSLRVSVKHNILPYVVEEV